MSDEIEKINKLCNDVNEGRKWLPDVAEEDLPKLIRASAHMNRHDHAGPIFAQAFIEELRHRRNLKAQESQDRSSKATASLTKALIWVGSIQAAIYFAQLLVMIFGKKTSS